MIRIMKTGGKYYGAATDIVDDFEAGNIAHLIEEGNTIILVEELTDLDNNEDILIGSVDVEMVD